MEITAAAGDNTSATMALAQAMQTQQAQMDIIMKTLKPDFLKKST